jgi:hypothetical protein
MCVCVSCAKYKYTVRGNSVKTVLHVNTNVLRVILHCLSEDKLLYLKTNTNKDILISPTKYTYSQVLYITIIYYDNVLYVSAFPGPSSGRKQIQELYEIFMFVIIEKCSSCMYQT